MEQNNYRIDESLQAKLLFGGRLAVKYMGQYQLEYQCKPPLEKPINICQKLNPELNRADLISNITLPEPNNFNQHFLKMILFNSGMNGDGAGRR